MGEETVNVSWIEKLLDALSITGSMKTAAGVIIALGVILILGFLMTRLTKLLKLPNVTAYILVGILIGPSVINLIPQEFITRTDFLSDIALAFIAFSAGEFFKISELKKAGGKVLIITLMECLLAFSIVFVLCLFIFNLSAPFSLVLASLASATAPASTLMIIKQTKAKGEYVNILLEVVALDNILTLILYSVAISICIAMTGGSGNLGFMDVGWPIVKNIICLAIGFVFGFILRFLISSKRTTDNRLIIVLAVILLFCGVCSLFEQSPLLGCMAIGMVYTNTAREDDKLFGQVNYFIPPIMLLFFVRSGMNLQFSAFTSSSSLTTIPLLIIALVFMIARLLGKYGGAYLGCLVTRTKQETRNYLGFGLFPQASVAIGLAAMGVRTFNSVGMEDEAIALMAIVITASVICELIGPALAKLGLYLSHSYGKETIDEVVPQSTVEQAEVEEGSSKEIDILAAQIKRISEESPTAKTIDPNEEAFNEVAEDYEGETYSRNYKRFINRK